MLKCTPEIPKTVGGGTIDTEGETSTDENATEDEYRWPTRRFQKIRWETIITKGFIAFSQMWQTSSGYSMLFNLFVCFLFESW